MNNDNSDAGGEHELTYRQEVLSKLFDLVSRTDSFYLIGGASMGKTRLLDFLMRNNVQKYYLKDAYPKTWLVRVDLNRMPISDNWGFYFFELLLSSIALCCIGREDVDSEVMKELVDLDSKVIERRDTLCALRFFEWEVSKICQKYDIKLCFLFDEFDEAYRKLPREVFAQLRAVRDANKSRLLYGMFLRVSPKKLRTDNDNESFYELVTRNVIGIGPYTRADIIDVIQNLEKEWDIKITPEKREKIASASGGHPGMVKVLLSLVKEPLHAQKLDDQNWLSWFSIQETILEECEKIWRGLEDDEKSTLLAPFQGGNVNGSAAHLLAIKGVLQKSDTGGKVFSPFFEQYLRSGLAKV